MRQIHNQASKLSYRRYLSLATFGCLELIVCSAPTRHLLRLSSASLRGKSPDGISRFPFNVPIDGHVCGLGAVKHEEFAMASGEMTEAEFTDFLSTVLGHMST